MTVGELIALLQREDPSAPVVGTWEGIFEEVHVYRGADGTVLLDVDGCSYRSAYQAQGWNLKEVRR